jgi:uncharacterized phage protein (TIGR02220 family)
LHFLFSAMNGYDLSRNWFNFCFDNPELIKPIHSAIFFFACEHCNRLGGKDKFGFPSQMTMEAIGVKKYQTYGKALSDLVDWGFITMIERSRNQYSANIISISAVPKNGIARGKALDKAMVKHRAKQGHGTGQSKDSIDKPLTIETVNQETISKVVDYLNEIVGSSYKPTTGKTVALVKARINEGFTVDDFKKVIDVKSKQWLKDADMAKYLRPETLFSPKFEGYLNEQPEPTVKPLKLATLDANGNLKVG